MYSNVAGTLGYIDPEYYQKFAVNKKSDVYRYLVNDNINFIMKLFMTFTLMNSFGVVLLELITGLPALFQDDSITDPDDSKTISLVNWVQPYIDNVTEIVDQRIDNGYNSKALFMFAKLAKSCTERSGKYRPLMDEVCFRLLQIKNVINGVEDETKGSETTSTQFHSVPHSKAFGKPKYSSSGQEDSSIVVAPMSGTFLLR